MADNSTFVDPSAGDVSPSGPSFQNTNKVKNTKPEDLINPPLKKKRKRKRRRGKKKPQDEVLTPALSPNSHPGPSAEPEISSKPPVQEPQPSQKDVNTLPESAENAAQSQPALASEAQSFLKSPDLIENDPQSLPVESPLLSEPAQEETLNIAHQNENLAQVDLPLEEKTPVTNSSFDDHFIPTSQPFVFPEEQAQFMPESQEIAASSSSELSKPEEPQPEKAYEPPQQSFHQEESQPELPESSHILENPLPSPVVPDTKSNEELFTPLSSADPIDTPQHEPSFLDDPSFPEDSPEDVDEKPLRVDEDRPNNVVEVEGNPDELLEEINLIEKKSFLEKIKPVLDLIKKFFTLFDRRILKNCFLILVVAIGVYAFYAFHLFQVIYQFGYGLLNPPKPPQIEVTIDDNNLNGQGINTGLLFADNEGSIEDRLNSSLKNALYFGKLAEPQVKGETGVTPSYYYGLLEDQVDETNQFIDYIKNLRTLQDFYHTDVYAMLDQTTERDKKLLDYLQQLKDIREKSNIFGREISAQIDDLKVSNNSLVSDIKNFENDFFVSMQSLAGEKSDFLLKSFIDANQKHVALKARLGALNKLAEYYNTALKRLDTRIEAVDKNRDALIQGIRVIDIPGSDIDIIIKKSG